LGPTSGKACALPRIGIHSSTLIRLLADMAVADVAVADVAGPQPTVAERLGQWLDWTDAATLATALDLGNQALRAPPLDGEPAHAPAIADAVAQVRAVLARAITTDGLWAVQAAVNPAVKSLKPPPRQAAAPADDETDFAPYRRSHLAHQRAMEARLGPLRVSVRAALVGASPALGQLAALDAALDQALGVRERHLLGSVTTLLEARFQRLCEAQPAGWLMVYRKDMQAVLLAELDVRLQPIEGMMDALRTLHNEAGSPA